VVARRCLDQHPSTLSPIRQVEGGIRIQAQPLRQFTPSARVRAAALGAGFSEQIGYGGKLADSIIWRTVTGRMIHHQAFPTGLYFFPRKGWLRPKSFTMLRCNRLLHEVASVTGTWPSLPRPKQCCINHLDQLTWWAEAMMAIIWW